MKKNSVVKRTIKILKKRIRLSSILFLVVLFSANTFAWFLYATKVNTGITAHVRAWNVLFEVGQEEITKYMTFNIDEIYPGMQTYAENVTVTNRGESQASLSFEILSVSILGDVYEVTETGILTSDSLLESIRTDYPFKINLGINNPIIEPGSASAFTLNVSWPYESGDDELDTYWGSKAFDFHALHPDESSISLTVLVNAVQS